MPALLRAPQFLREERGEGRTSNTVRSRVRASEAASVCGARVRLRGCERRARPPDSAVPLMPPRRKRAMSPRVLAFPLFSSVHVTPLRTCCVRTTGSTA
eukprot:6203138-Pleurochrysis_carterae.AAC.3